ncbi:MAG: VWA domain-containing protein [Myxococcota bacterium]
MAVDKDKLKRWRLILGETTEESFAAMAGLSGAILSAEEAAMDGALEALYPSSHDLDQSAWKKKHIGKKGAKAGGSTVPKVARWLGEIREFFPRDVVTLMQNDAIERRGMKELLFEPEVMAKLEPNLDIAATVLELKDLVPEQAKAEARVLVSRAVEEVRRLLETQFVQAIRGSLDRSRHSPFRSLPNLDFARTVRRNLKHFDAELGTLVPEHISFFSRQQRRNEWNVIIAMDQSGSMHNSLIYGGIMGAILASIPAVETHVVAFNHQDVVDLTEHCTDPVDLLFGVQLGGAEDYWKATTFCERFMHTPEKTLYVILGDLYDTSHNEKRFVQKMEHLLGSGIKALTLLAISDQGQPAYNRNLAGKLSKLGMPCFGCTPNHLPEMLAAVLQGSDLQKFADSVRLASE